MMFNLALGTLLLTLFLLVIASLRILREYERGVLFQLGRFWKVKGPGMVIVIPALQQMLRVDLRPATFDVPPQDVISRDNVSVRVNAVLFFCVVDAQKAIIQSMVRAIARQAEAERERRAKVIHAEGERQAASALIEAATLLACEPGAMQLRYLQTMTQLAGDRATTFVLPLPIDVLGSITAGHRPAKEG